jgi:hypothetical protein
MHIEETQRLVTEIEMFKVVFGSKEGKEQLKLENNFSWLEYQTAHLLQF